MQELVTPFPTSTTVNDTIFYNIVGNFIPPEWRNLASHDGKALSKTSKQLLSLIASCIQTLSESNDKVEELQESYYYFEQALGVCQKRIRQCLLELRDGGFIQFTLNTVVKHYIKCRNILCIKLTKNFIPYRKKFSTEPEKSFGYSGKKFPPLHIIDNNISINKSRYRESSFKNEIFENENLVAENQNTSGSIHNLEKDLSQGSTSIATTESNETSSNRDSSLVSRVVNTAKTWWGMKKAEEFHPLTEEDAEVLRLRSGREFNLNFMNKLLLKLADSQPNNRFSSKERLLNYMAKALASEMRNPNMVNNENFNFQTNDFDRKKEEFLKEIEFSSDVSPEGQLKRKISAVFERDIAYDLLKAGLFSEVVEGVKYRLKLKRNIQIAESTKRILLNQIQAVYGNKIERLEIIVTRNFTTKPKETKEISVESYIDGALAGLDPIWRNIRKYLINLYGKAIDEAWFSKLELVKKDETNNKLFLKPETNCIGNWVSHHYITPLRLAFESFNYSYEIVKA